jgi:tRNA dimethylallyltransferase
VGGTGLYFRALANGIADLPAADPGVRARLAAQAKRSGWPALHRELSRADPVAAARIHPHDPQRIQRALEVYELTGRPMSQLWASQKASPHAYRFIKIVSAPSNRLDLHERLHQRFLDMLATGLLDEVRDLYGRGDLSPDLPAVRLVGYRQIWQYLDGQQDWDRAVERALTATRQLAKRQLTWLRAEPNARWFDSHDQSLYSNVLKYLRAQ